MNGRSTKENKIKYAQQPSKNRQKIIQILVIDVVFIIFVVVFAVRV